MHEARYWIFQANSKYFDLVAALQQSRTITWIITRYRQEMDTGDKVAVWLSGKHAGIYALGHIESFIVASNTRPDARFWLTHDDWTFVGKQHAVVAVDRDLASTPILKSSIQRNKILSTATILRAPWATNFRLSREQWEEIKQLST